MKKLSVVVLVLLLVSQVTYGQSACQDCWIYDDAVTPILYTNPSRYVEWVGIGKTNPGYTLDVNGVVAMTGFFLPTGAGSGKVLTSDVSGHGSWQARLWTKSGSNIYRTTGNVGIGTDNPIEQLTTTSNALIGKGTYPAIFVRDRWWWSGLLYRTETPWGDEDSYVITLPQMGTENRPFVIQSKTTQGKGAGTPLMLIESYTGNVGIGTTSPDYKLEIVGDIRAGKVIAGDGASPGGYALSGVGNGSGYQGGVYAEGDMVDFYAGSQDGVSIFTGRVEIGDRLDVNGRVAMSDFRLVTGAANGYVLTSDGSGVGTWQALSSGLWSQSGSNIYYNSGNVGIGTDDPDGKLNINGSTRIGCITDDDGSTPGYGDYLYFSGGDDWSGWTSDNSDPIWMARYNSASDASQLRINVGDSPSASDKIEFGTTSQSGEWTPAMVVRADGNVGIGTTEPQSKLAVNGTITAREVIVTIDGWPDFVFSDNHKLMSLNKLEKHIKKEKSLPGIPTEIEVLKDGVKVGDMQAKLLEKVEELTLYVINQNKEISELKKENKELKRLISTLEK